MSTTIDRGPSQVAPPRETRSSDGRPTARNAGRRLGEAARTALWLIPALLASAGAQVIAIVLAPVAPGSPDAVILTAAVARVGFELVSATLFFFIARRVGLSRPMATIVVLTFGAAAVAVLTLPQDAGHLMAVPVALAVALPALLGAVLLGLSRHRQMAGFVSAAVILALAVVILPITVLAVPMAGWLFWHRARPATRRYTLAVAATVFVLVVGAGVVHALVTGTLDRGFVGGLIPALVGRGDDPEPVSLAGPAAGVALVAVSLAGAVLVAALRRGRRFRLVFMLLAALTAAIPLAAGPSASLLPMAAAPSVLKAEAWVEANAPESSRVISDSATVADLKADGVDAGRLTAVGPGDASVPVSGPADGSYILATDQVGVAAAEHPELRSALRASTIIARFGSGRRAVEVRRVEADTDSVSAQAAADRAALAAGSDLARNPRLKASRADLAVLASGGVDARVSLALGQFLATEAVSVSGFPVVPGDTGALARQVVITSVGGASTRGTTSVERAVAAAIRKAPAAFRPLRVTATRDGLVLTYPTEPFASGD